MSHGSDEHLARLLLLVDAFGGTDDSVLDGMTKLAKLDFLLRYPAFLEDLIEEPAIRDRLMIQSEERAAVSDPMIRYRYGPWDQRYFALVGGLVGRGLVDYVQGRGRVALRTTAKGRAVAAEVRSDPAWRVVARRVDLLRERFDFSGSALKEMIYARFPSLVAQPLRSAIAAAPEEGTP